MRIVFPLLGFNVSGGIRVITNIANTFAAEGHPVRIIVPDYAATPPFKLADGVELQVIRTRGAGVWRKIYYFIKLCFIAARGGDVGFATSYKTPYCLLFSKIVRFSSIRLCYLVQGYEPLSHVQLPPGNRIVKKLLYAMAKYGYKLPLHKIAVSTWIKEQIGDKSIKVISNGVDLAIFSPADQEVRTDDEFVIGIMGGSSRLKGYDVFLKAIELLGGGMDLKVLVLSQENLSLPKGVTAELIRPAGDDSVVRFYRQCDVFVFASLAEGFGLPPLEAMACGIPVITTDCGGISDFANDANAIIVPTNNPQALAQAIRKLREDKELRGRLRQHGLATAQTFSLFRMLAQYRELIGQIERSN